MTRRQSYNPLEKLKTETNANTKFKAKEKDRNIWGRLRVTWRACWSTLKSKELCRNNSYQKSKQIISKFYFDIWDIWRKKNWLLNHNNEPFQLFSQNHYNMTFFWDFFFLFPRLKLKIEGHRFDIWFFQSDHHCAINNEKKPENSHFNTLWWEILLFFFKKKSEKYFEDSNLIWISIQLKKQTYFLIYYVRKW